MKKRQRSSVTIIIIPFLSLALLLAPGCEIDLRTETKGIPRIDEVFKTALIEEDNLDSQGVWSSGDGKRWVISTAMNTSQLVVYDAVDGKFITRAAHEGKDEGDLFRPIGITVAGDYAFVVERNNRRVQIFKLPELTSIGSFGDSQLRRPYGITAYGEGKTFYIFVTDNYRPEKIEDIPKDHLRGERIKKYQVTVDDGNFSATFIKAFGDTSGEGVLKNVESIAADPAYNRLLVSEEKLSITSVKVYNLDGEFTGDIIGADIFRYQAEGIALYECSDSTGYWVVVDQDPINNAFRVFDRRTLAFAGSFTGSLTFNSDGLAILREQFGDFPEGALYTSHNDGSVSAFSWKTIADSLSLSYRSSRFP